MDNTIGIDIESHHDLRHTTRSRRNTNQVKLLEQLVVSRHLALALENADRHRRLVVLGGGEYLALLCRDRCVAFDQFGKNAT